MRRALFVAVVLCVAAVAAFFWLRRGRQACPVPATASQPVPGDDALQVVQDTNAAYEDRVLALKRMPKVLSPDQAKALHELMLTKGTHPTIRNEIVVLLKSQPEKPLGIAPELMQMLRDESEDVTWRDYCLQHLEAVYDFSAEKELIEKTLFEVAAGKADTKANYPGTALLALQRLAKRCPEIQPRLQELARSGVASRTDDPEKAVTSLQVACAAKDKSILTEARKIAADEKALVRLRMSAIGTLGEIGEQEDLAILSGLCESSESRISRAAKASLQSLTKGLQK